MHKKMHKNGFTLVELLVVAGLAVVILISASSLLFTSLVSNNRRDTITTIKQEGDYATNQMEFLLRNAVRLEPNPSAPNGPSCTAGMNSITLRSQDNGITTLAIVNNKIASSSSTQTTYLTSDAITLNTQTPLFDCQQVSNVGGYVTIHFSVSLQNTAYSATANTVSENFTTSVNLRSF